MKLPDLDDKDLVIVGVVLLAGISMFVMPDAEILKNAFTGLFGVAVGSRLSQ